MRRLNWRATARRVAIVGLASAVLVLIVWALPASVRRPLVRVRWVDRGDWIKSQVLHLGLDRAGFVHQERDRVWTAATAAALDDVRAAHGLNPEPFIQLPPSDSWRLQVSDYGHNHVYLPGGVIQTEDGVLHTVPYVVVAIVLAAPAGLWGMSRAWQRLRRQFF